VVEKRVWVFPLVLLHLLQHLLQDRRYRIIHKKEGWGWGGERVGERDGEREGERDRVQDWGENECVCVLCVCSYLRVCVCLF
jgi:hypothetical protein